MKQENVTLSFVPLFKKRVPANLWERRAIRVMYIEWPYMLKSGKSVKDVAFFDIWDYKSLFNFLM